MFTLSKQMEVTICGFIHSIIVSPLESNQLNICFAICHHAIIRTYQEAIHFEKEGKKNMEIFVFKFTNDGAH